MTNNITITISQTDYAAMRAKAQAFDWIAATCFIDSAGPDCWQDGWAYADPQHPELRSPMTLTEWATQQREYQEDREPDYLAPTAGESMDAARAAAREAGR